MIKFSTLFKTVATNFATALNTANEHDALPHERNRRLWKKAKNWGRRTFNHAAAAARRKAEQHARWVQAQAHKHWLKAKAHARRVAAEAKRKARQLAATARAFVNTIKNKFGGFNGVLKAFRIVFFLYGCDAATSMSSTFEICH